MFFSRRDSIPSRYFRCVHLCPCPTILAFFQSIFSVYVYLCLVSPPSLAFIGLLVESMLTASRSSLVRRALLQYSVRRQFSWQFSWRCHPSMSTCYSHMKYFTLLLLSPNGVLTLVVRSFTLFESTFLCCLVLCSVSLLFLRSLHCPHLWLVTSLGKYNIINS